MEGLAGLLDAARASTSGEDLAGERAAVAGFLAARQRAVPTAPPRRRNRAVRVIAMKVALGFAVLACGGTALAARTGSLPTAVQERAHTAFSDVGVPPPAPARSSRVTTGGITASAVPSPTPHASATPGPSDPATVELCRAWETARRDPPGKAVPPEIRRALAAAAGGVPRIDEFCAGELGKVSEPAKPTGSDLPSGPGKEPAGPPAPATPSHPGKGNGRSKGPGN